MEQKTLEDVLLLIEQLPFFEVPDAPLPITKRNIVLPRLTWDKMELEQMLSVKLPEEMIQVWKRTSGLFLFQDATYGQSGLVIWSPDATIIRHKRCLTYRVDGEFSKGDLLIGEFLGDSDLLLLRCDPAEPDFGSVMIVLPLDSRKDWDRPATSIIDFVKIYFDSKGEKFWERKSNE